MGWRVGVFAVVGLAIAFWAWPRERYPVAKPAAQGQRESAERSVGSSPSFENGRQVSAEVLATLTTDSRGAFVFPGIPPTEFDLRTRAPDGRETSSHEKLEGSETDLVVVLPR